MKSFICAYIIFVASLSDAPSSFRLFCIWNVGQGQWITQVTPDRCTHFDFGGEIQFFQALQSRVHHLCARKMNELYLSHADLDHYAFLPLLLSRLPKICWRIKPDDSRLVKYNSIPACLKVFDQQIESQNLLIECIQEKRNDCSSIFRREQFLIPGDSPIKKEKLWIHYLTSLQKIKVLVLGHHGSATSTGNLLLQRLPQLHTAIASARYKVYGHPNKKVIARLKQFGLKVLTTESWGNIILLQD